MRILLPPLLLAAAAALLHLTPAGGFLPRALAAFPDGPPPAHTGGFGEPTCAECHAGGATVEGGSLRILDLPEVYEPGRRYRLRVELRHAGMRRGGFQLAARFHDSAAQAGTFVPADSTVAVRTQQCVQYAQHTRVGSAARADSAMWLVEWQAPERGGRVEFHAAANAADDDASPLGDVVYTTQATSGR